MIIAIPIIMWLRIFVNDLNLQVISLPWEPNYSLNESLWILPHWIFLLWIIIAVWTSYYAYFENYLKH